MKRTLTKRPRTQNAGAALERQAVRNWAKRRTDVTRAALLEYLDGRTARDNAKPGGLGKR